MSGRRFIIVRVGAHTIRIETTYCQWCTDTTVCGVCHARAEKARKRRTKTPLEIA